MAVMTICQLYLDPWVIVAMVHYQLPNISYSYDDLAPFIDAKVLEAHHKHHQLYVDGLNTTLQRIGGSRHPQHISAILANLGSVPESERDAVAFFGGGFENHRLLWETLTPRHTITTTGASDNSDTPSLSSPVFDTSLSRTDPVRPDGLLMDAIEIYFGGFDRFQEIFTTKALDLQGSGWCWLVLNPIYNRTEIITTANQDNPLMFRFIPLLGLDLWEHAYYLQYQDNRLAYIEAWWNVINWQNVEARFSVSVGQ